MCVCVFMFWEDSAALRTTRSYRWTKRESWQNASKKSIRHVSKLQGHIKQPVNNKFPSARRAWISDVCNFIFHDKLTVHKLVKKFPTFCEIRRFITTLTSAPDLSLSWATATQSMPLHPTFWRYFFNIISPCTQKLCFLHFVIVHFIQTVSTANLS